MNGMNDQVRKAVRQRMKALSMTQAELGDAVGMAQPHVARLLSGTVGAIPESWQKVLDALDLELVAQPRKDG